MNIPPKLEGTICVLIGIAGIYPRLKNPFVEKQMNFDPITQQETLNVKATLLRRNLMIALFVCVIVYGFFELTR